jgi:hypothetical protein
MYVKTLVSLVSFSSSASAFGLRRWGRRKRRNRNVSRIQSPLRSADEPKSERDAGTYG